MWKHYYEFSAFLKVLNTLSCLYILFYIQDYHCAARNDHRYFVSIQRNVSVRNMGVHYLQAIIFPHFQLVIKCRNTTVFWFKTFWMQWKEDFYINQLKSLTFCLSLKFVIESACLTQVDFTVICLGVLVCYLILIFGLAVSQRLFV